VRVGCRHVVHLCARRRERVLRQSGPPLARVAVSAAQRT
jgi:hypothetical protein